MTAYTGFDPIVGTLITDPDDLTYDVNVAFASSTKEIVINTTAKTIALKVNGNLTTDGAVIKAVYSKLKDAWRVDTTLIKFPFPMGPITDEQFEMVNGWNWDKSNTSGAATQTTPELLRTGGWSVVNTAGAITENWFSVVTLGTLGELDQVYYQQVDEDTASVDFVLTGPVNQAVQSLSDPNGDGSYGDGYDRRTYFKIFVREWQKIYAQSTIGDIGVSSLTFQAYRFPLTNAADLKVTNTEAYVGGVATASGTSSGTTATVNTAVAHGLTTGDTITVSGVTPSGYNGTYTVTVSDTDTITYTTVGSDLGPITVQGTVQLTVYANVDVTYLRDAAGEVYNIRGDWAVSTLYAVGDVVKGSDGRWYAVTTGGTSAGNSSDLDGGSDTGGAVYASYTGERLIGTTYYAFNVIIDADNTVAATSSGNARTAQIYEIVQYKLRQNSDIDDGTGTGATVTGKTATALLSFVGDTLVTSQGVFIDSYNAQDTNLIQLTTWGGTNNFQTVTVNFPFVAALTVNFGQNLQDDQYSKYWVFFTNANGNEFGTTNAIIVQDNDDNDMAGNVNPSWPTKRAFVSHTFDYDNNVQGGRTGNTNADITVVGIGLTTGQYVSATGTIARSTANSVSLVAALERNYTAGSVFP